MPRPKLIRTSNFAYHVYARSNNKEWFYIPIEECWRILCECLSISAHKYGAIPYSLVLMSNHFHLILITPLGNLDAVMQHFLSTATKRIQQRAGRINHIFGLRYKWSLLETPYAIACALKYVYRNPVRAGICRQVEDYPFSTLNDFTLLPVSEGCDAYWNLVPKGREERSLWLNKPSKTEHEALVGRALRRSKFGFSTSSNLQKPLRDLRQEYFSTPVEF